MYMAILQTDCNELLKQILFESKFLYIFDDEKIEI